MGNEIKRWQQSVVRDGDTEASSSKRDGFTSRLSKAACALFHLCLDQGHLRTIRPHRRELSRVYGYLQLWCDGYGALSGDLDVALSESKRLRHSTYRLLVSICHILAERMTTALSADLDNDWQHELYKEAARARDLIEEATFANGGDDGSDSGSDSGSETSSMTSDFNIEEIIKDLETDIRCLVDLGPRYKEPIRDRTVKEQAVLPSLALNWDPAEHLASRIQHRYPDGDAALAHAFGKMNWERAKRLYAAREANARAVERPPMKLIAASAAQGTVVASDFHDSGLGTTLASPTSYAETVLSYRGTKGGSISVPQIPAEGMKGEPFICGICGCTCQLPQANWKSSWKRHVFSDLEPYACVIADCKFGHVPFPHKYAWIQHLKLEHDFPSVSRKIACPLCQERVGSGGIAHLARHLEEVSLTILPTNTESDDESDGNAEEASRDEPNISEGTLAKSSVDPTSSGGSRVPGVSKPGGKHNRPAWSRATALYDLKPARASELPLVKGQDLWILKLAERAPGAAWIPALGDQGQRQGWVPRSYARLVRSNKSLAEGDGATQPTVEGPEPPHPGTEFEFHTPWGESYQAALPSAFPPLSPLEEPRANIGAGKLEGAVTAEPKTTGNTKESEAAIILPLLEALRTQKGSVDDRQNNGDFVLFEGARDNLVYFPPLFDDTEAPRASQELSEAAYGDGPREESRHPVPWSLFTCPEPGCSFRARKDNLERHRRRHRHDRENWPCMERGCGTSWSTKELLDQHRTETHAKTEIETQAWLDKPSPGVGREMGLDDPDLESESQSYWKRVPDEDSDMQVLLRSSYGRVTAKKKDIV